MDGVADVIPEKPTGVQEAVATPPAQPDSGADKGGGRWSRIWPVLRTVLVIGVPAVASAAVVLFAVKPTQAPPRDEGVAAAWNDSISRLGVWPIYPPEEDVYVGDLWAVLLVNEPDQKTPGATLVENGKKPILATSARIGHIDLTSMLMRDEARRVRFRRQVSPPDGAGEAAGAGTTAPGAPSEGISPSLVAFPGVTISQGRKVATAFGTGWFGWGASNEGASTDEIHLTDASTYGVPLGEAFGAMLRWCSAEGEVVCGDAYARRVLAQTGISGTLDFTADGSAYRNRIELRLVSRAFLARTIEQKHSTDSGRGLGARTSSDGTASASGGQQVPTPTTGDATSALAGRAQAVAATAEASRNGASFMTVRSDGTSIEMKSTTYARPIVFGYRAASMLLEPVAPEKGPKQ